MMMIITVVVGLFFYFFFMWAFRILVGVLVARLIGQALSRLQEKGQDIMQNYKEGAEENV
jgi:hypothetical protein